ncbi:MAG: DNA mismatch repair protein MutS [Flavobacteriaceae bacterium]|jgi:DNA mismatch repair protein MutS2|nr:DNA mismatch repair protein MutS [Flavobacteriaceae bacterium]MDO7603114.1 DNA mismatch repair protein MutS [Flavobacteriaceae bacterium]
MKIPEKALTDLEFTTVLQQLSQLAITSMGKESCLSLQPFENEQELILQLESVSEFTASFANENRIPNHGFDDLTSEINLLKIENSVLELEGFRRIAAASDIINILLKFFKKFKEYYPRLFEQSTDIEITKDLIIAINNVIDRFGEVRNDASPELFQIRKSIQTVRSKIGQSFQRALSQYTTADYLDDIKESVVENRRVLAVKAMHRRKVKGAIMGSSKTGSIVYIEPETTLQHTRELNNLQFEETDEIKRILLALTQYLQPYRSLLIQYQKYLILIDTYHARAKYAESTNSILPKINSNRELTLVNAFHPLLYLSNKKEGKTTFPQDIILTKEQRIIVISGPNAGGKSITLKTVGLLQLMLQTGMLIPVHEQSTVCFFDQIITDIGDNQSIENHLSTYSYRLKNMKYFIRKCNKNTLFLIDEFGTGSDPELGGALAESFLEEFYNREAYGIITTHYSNLKVLANELPNMSNANMQFDNRTLEPIFNLILGEAGSSFTFEVAQKNGIPYSLINRAKKKIERGKVRFDATIAKLQKERSQMTKTGDSLRKQESKAIEENNRLEVLNKKIKEKLIGYQELFDHNQRMIVLGNKVNEVADRYFDNGKKRPLVADLLRLVEGENSKRKKKSSSEKKKDKEVKEKANAEANKAMVIIRKEKKKKKKAAPVPVKVKVNFKLGDQVRLFDGKAVGTIDSIEKEKAIVNYGMFTTQVRLEALDLVQAAKIKK